MLAVDVQQLSYQYGSRAEDADSFALNQLDLQVEQGEIFGLLGPNGSGKTTLFRLLSTVARIQSGEISIFGKSIADDRATIRSLLGIVFQSPSLDPKLTVLENIRCQAALYGLTGSSLQERISAVTEQLGIANRLQTRTDELSGGLKRRVELAKGILHRPKLLLMDEPSTGLDPASRLDLWHAIKTLRDENAVTVLLTTHLLEEADKADRIAIMDKGSTVAVGKPAELRTSLGQRLLSIQTDAGEDVQAWLESRSVNFQQVEHQLRVHGPQAVEVIAPLAETFGEQIQSLTLGQPSLEDVFVARTGHRFWDEQES